MHKIQKLLHFIFLNTREKEIIKQYKKLKKLSNLTKNENESRQLDKLSQLLNHAYCNVPYYKKVIFDSGLIKGNKVQLTSLGQLKELPFLTKDIIREEKEKIYSVDAGERRSYKNTSGGSTGEPVIFMQDREYQVNNLANFNLARYWRGVGPYESTIYLWGAPRDTFEGKKPIKSYIQEFITNSIVLNCFNLTDKDIRNYINIINKHKPSLIIAYAQVVYEIAKFAKEHNINISKQNSIHTGAGTLHEYMRIEIEEVFGCKVYNHYGSREVGSIASECNAHNGLHVFSDNILIEIVNEDGRECEDGEEGEIVITTLNNYSMPLIRYKIGDMGIMQKYKECSCGSRYPKLEKVIGRTTDMFKTKAGNRIDGVAITLFFYNYNWISQYQIIQEEIGKIIINIVLNDNIDYEELDKLEKNIQLIMGDDDCKVDFKFLDNIPKTKTGKFLYTISKV